MAEFHSYEPHLKRLCLDLRPRSVLEWGPGSSTEIILAHCCAEIVAIEHDASFHHALVGKFGNNSRITLVHKPTGISLGGSEAYVTYPLYLERLFDLVVIDGRQRCDCLAVAAMVLEPNGVALLHDSERSNYHAAYRFFGKIEEHDGTTLLSRPLVRISRKPADQKRALQLLARRGPPRPASAR